MAGRDTKTDIIRAGMGMIARKGFNSSGLDAILRKAGVPKGSFYHYFQSKQDFGLEVIDHFAADIDRIFQSYLTDDSLPPLTRFRNCIDNLISRFENNNCSIGCLAANLGQELADRSEEFRIRLAGIFQSWIGHFEKCLAQACERGEISPGTDTRKMAEIFLCGFEGALLVSKVMKTSTPLRDFVSIYFDEMLMHHTLTMK
jgi:TetR/AcrR family transcriptional repressor of nem operon